MLFDHILILLDNFYYGAPVCVDGTLKQNTREAALLTKCTRWKVSKIAFIKDSFSGKTSSYTPLLLIRPSRHLRSVEQIGNGQLLRWTAFAKSKAFLTTWAFRINSSWAWSCSSTCIFGICPRSTTIVHID